MKTLSRLFLCAALLVCAQIVYGYGASTVTQRIDLWIIKKNTAFATMGNFGLNNGSYSVYAEVDSADSKQGSFGNENITSLAYDIGAFTESGVANAYVNGYDEQGNFQMDTDSDSN